MTDGEPMFHNTLNKGLQVMGRDTGPAGDHRAREASARPHRPCSRRAHSMAHDTEKKVPTARQGVRRQPGDGDKNKIRGIYNRAAY
jgi:hypothetical protein